jgi:hypothetical protein
VSPIFFTASAATLPWVGLVDEEPEADADGPDLVGTLADPVLSWWADAESVWFRVQLAQPLDGVVAVLVDADIDWNTFELAFVASADGAVAALANGGGVAGTWTDAVTVAAADAGAATFDGSVVFIEIPRSVLHDTLGIPGTEPLRLSALSAASWEAGPSDVAGCDGACEVLSLVSSDAVLVDEDEDGLADPQEALLGTNEDDDDTDNDGVSDLDEADDLDGDGKSDANECDADGDGLTDGVERGVTARLADTTGTKCFVADADPGTVSDPGAADSDGGGLADGVEDPDRDGRRDAWEGDPNDPADDADADGDLVPDGLDDLFGAGPDDDSDGDGIPDAAEPIGDLDGDDVPSFADLDADGDGIDDATEGTDDPDGDKVPNFLDKDADGDGALDVQEGWPDSQVEDLDDDGLLDGEELATDTDGDGVIDRLDLDSDDDGLLDEDEGADDTDEDGIPDCRDLDSDGDGLPDAVEGDDDPDDDRVPNYRDTDSDGDRLPDAAEPDGDVDCDGAQDRYDPDPEDSFCDTLEPPAVGTGIPPDPPRAPAEVGGGCSHAPGGPSAWAGLLAALGLAFARAGRRG